MGLLLPLSRTVRDAGHRERKRMDTIRPRGGNWAVGGGDAEPPMVSSRQIHRQPSSSSAG